MAEKKTREPIDRLRATLAFEAPVTCVSMVSPKRAQALGKLQISTVRDLVSNFPRRYIDMSQVKSIAQASTGQTCTIRAKVHEVKSKRPRRNLPLVEVTLVDNTGAMIVTAFRQPWLADQLKSGMTVAVSGKMEFNFGFKRMTNPYIEVLEGEGEGFHGKVVPVHPLTGPIKAGLMRRLVSNALEDVRGCIDPLPVSIRAKYQLMSRYQALSCIHFPQDMQELNQARRRLAYEEVLLLQLVLMSEAMKRGEGKTPVSHVIDGARLSQLAKEIPFELTDEQVKARDEILERMAQPQTANHMLLGDVGTGKTIVSAFAIASAADTGGQVLFMAPTEILASQHASGLGPLLEKVGITSALLTGSTSEEERKGILGRLSSGEVDVVFGTHALLEPQVKAFNCTLVVIDEQQRFGVEQRASLLAKGDCPDALYLTATPIPRTLALALYGSLSLSYIKKRPKAAAPRTTHLHSYEEKGRAYDAAREACGKGQQVYVVCPLVGEKRSSSSDGADSHDEDAYEFDAVQIEDESDMVGSNIRAAEDEAAFLQAKVFPEYKVGVVHGKLPAVQKQLVMDAFRAGNIDVLVATTVIEVGVDVPNATVMIVEDADRFGLSQLHQLRGRVGRGGLPSQVHLISGTRKESALERLAAMERTDDGFELASYDLSLRREGDILGNRQHGASLLSLVNVVRDGAIIEAAHRDAREMLSEDPALESDQYRCLAREARLVYRHAQELAGG